MRPTNILRLSKALRVLLVFAVANAFLVCGQLMAEDWPQWQGPNRANKWVAENIIDKFPEDGPAVLWRSPVANGYAGPAVVGNRLYVTDFVTEADVKVSNFDRNPAEGVERVMCVDATSGEMVWKHETPVKYAISYPSGPRTTPLVEGDRVYTLGAEGHLICFARESGEVVWERELKEDYKTTSALWGYVSHPLIDGNRLICTVGGEGSHTVAFDKQTGKELWKYGTASEQGYSPPSIITFARTRQLILMSPDWIASVNPTNGEEYWTKPYQATSGSIIMTPVQYKDYLFVGGYSKNNLMLRLSRERPGAEVVFQGQAKLALSPVNVQPFVKGDFMYGIDQDGWFRVVKMPSGERVFRTGQPIAERAFGSGTAFFVEHEDRYFMFTQNGELVIGTIAPEGITVIDRAKVLEPTNNAFGRPVLWSAPAYANGKMYVRNDEECICVELTKQQ